MKKILLILVMAFICMVGVFAYSSDTTIIIKTTVNETNKTGWAMPLANKAAPVTKYTDSKPTDVTEIELTENNDGDFEADAYAWFQSNSRVPLQVTIKATELTATTGEVLDYTLKVNDVDCTIDGITVNTVYTESGWQRPRGVSFSFYALVESDDYVEGVAGEYSSTVIATISSLN